MANKDSKGRNLKDYEYQMPDGRYRFRYTDKNGDRKCVYSWKLVRTDKLPQGKRDCTPLRDKEKEIFKDIQDGINPSDSSMTINQIWEKYINLKTNLKDTTRNNYYYLYNHFIKDSIGNRRIRDLKYSDIKSFYIDLLKTGKKVSTVNTIHCLLHPIFTLAVRDGIIRNNPTESAMTDIKKNNDLRCEQRHALTIDEQRTLMDFIKSSDAFKHWSPLITFLLGTGCRISEVIGLRWCDIDMKKKTISINHNTLYRSNASGEMTWTVTTPKTESGVRTIPLLPQVHDALIQERKQQLMLGIRCNMEIDGFTDFIFLNSNGNIYTTSAIDRAINRIYNASNKAEVMKAKEENREPTIIRHFSVHSLRHTFCTRLCEVESNIKLIMDVMGHADIQTTMNIYNEIQDAKKKSAFEELQYKLLIG